MREKSTTDEEQLIKACKEGRSWAQKAVYDIYASSMLSLCVRYVSDYETARDVLQDGFVKVFTKIDTYTGVGAFGGWVRRVIVTTALEYLRQNDALKQSTNLDDISNYIDNKDVSVIDKISADDLMNFITQLPDGYRTVFNLYAIEGYSHAEIAQMLNINDATSRSQFMRARKILQKNIQSISDYETYT